MSIKALQAYTFYSRYAKYISSKKRRETWKESISRVFDMHREKYKNEITQNSVLAELIDFAQKCVEKKQVLGSQRALQFGGDAILRKHERIYNCSSGHIDRPRAFAEAHALLLFGVGVGFSCQRHHIDRLPNIFRPTKGKKTYIVPDSIEGWADSIGVLLSSYFVKDQQFPEYFDYEVEFDYSQIRPKGSLISWGGIAPGPDGLRASHEKIVKLINRQLDRNETKLRPIDCYDILMHISDSVLSGGIRRCLPPSYEVLMSDGSYKKIGSISPGEEVLYKGSSFKVLNVFDNGIQALIRLDAGQYGYHLSTPSHRWRVFDHLTQQESWVAAERISKNPSEYSFVRDDGSRIRILSSTIKAADQTYDIEVENVHAFNARSPSGLESISHNSATICLFSFDDEEMINAKVGDWFLTNPQRGRSNNSALLVKDKISEEQFHALFKSTKEFGEPGFVWADHEDVSVNPCVEIGMWPIWTDENGKDHSGWQFCNLTEINGKKANTREAFLEACKASAIIGTLQAGYNEFPYLGEITEKITRREALLGCSITGMMDNPDILFDPEIQKEGAEEIRKWNKIVAPMIGVNPAARLTCTKPSGSASAVLGTASGVHPHHSKRYFRRVQANKMEFPARHFKKTNPLAVEESVWSANNTDEVITFLCEVPPGARLKNDLSAVEMLEYVKNTQMNWVEHGTNYEYCVRPFIRHNVSNTITVKPEEWDDVEKFIYANRKHFAGISLLSFSGDKDYDQAPFCAVYTPAELVKMYGDATVFASGLIVDCEHAFDTLFKGCDTLLGIGEMLTTDRLREHIRNCKDSGMNGFYITTHGYPKGYDVKLTADSSEEDLNTYLYQNVKNWDKKLDWIRRGNQFAERYFNGDLRQMTYCLKDVSNWKKWCDLRREYKEVDWENLVEEQHYIKVDEMAGAACAGGQCALEL